MIVLIELPDFVILRPWATANIQRRRHPVVCRVFICNNHLYASGNYKYDGKE